MARQRGGNALWIGLSLAGATMLSCAALIGIDERLPDIVDAAPDVAPGTCAAGEQCVAAPEGWSLVAFRAGATDCAPGYGERRDLSSAASSCDCTCGEVSKGSCGTGTITVRQFTGTDCTTNNFRSYDYDGGNPDAGPDADGGGIGDGGCIEQTAAFDLVESLRFGNASIAFNPANCGDGGGEAKPKPLEPVRTCKPSGGSCDDGGTCAAPVGAGEALCIVKDGDQECPSGYPAKIKAGASLGDDTRQCGTCTCASSDTSVCGKANIDIYESTSCTGKKVNVGVGFCTLYDGGGTFNSYQFHYPPAPYCAPTSDVPVVSGSLSFTDGVTVCCTSLPDGG